MKRMFEILALCILVHTASAIAGDVTIVQIAYVIKKIFPEAESISFFVSKEYWGKNEKKFTREVTISQIKSRVYIIENSVDIGKSLGEIGKNGVLVVLDSELLAQKSSVLYVLSKCKEKQIAVVTTCPPYSEAGALLGFLAGEHDELRLVVNLKHSEHLRSRFTEAFAQEVGVPVVMQ